MNTSLLEAAVSLSLTVVLAASLVGQVAGAAIIAGACWAANREVFDTRQVEHLLSEALARAARYPGTRGPLLEANSFGIVIAADLDRDGAIDPRSAERITVALEPSRKTYLLKHSVGLQTMIIGRQLPAGSHFDVFDATGGEIDDVERVALVALDSTGAASDAPPAYFAVPGRR
jgi:hypothetical protein